MIFIIWELFFIFKLSLSNGFLIGKKSGFGNVGEIEI